MNIFWLDKNFSLNASYYMDSHVRKIILECAQIMSTTCHHYGVNVRYRPTHVNHPLCIWARESEGNYEAIRTMAKHLNDEYVYRFDKICNHASYDYIKELPSIQMMNKEITMPPLCLPINCYSSTVVESYRNYYRQYKSHLAKWTKRDKPWWY